MIVHIYVFVKSSARNYIWCPAVHPARCPPRQGAIPAGLPFFGHRLAVCRLGRLSDLLGLRRGVKPALHFGDLGLEAGDDLLGIWRQARIGGETDQHLPCIADDADPQPELRRRGHPEHEAAQRDTDKVELLARPRHIGHHG